MTNSIHFLSEVDEIIVMKKGEILAQGTHKDLIENNQYFSKFVNNSFVMDHTGGEAEAKVFTSMVNIFFSYESTYLSLKNLF